MEASNSIWTDLIRLRVHLLVDLPGALLQLETTSALVRWCQYCTSLVYWFHSGTSEGPILVLNVSAQSGDVKFTKQLQAHSYPICALATNEKGRLASCDERGVIVVWLDPITCDDTFAVINDSR